MAFRPYMGSFEGQMLEIPMYNGGSSATYTLGDAITINSSGYGAAATSSTATDVIAIAAETKTVTTDGTLLNCYIVNPGQLWEADTDANWAQTDVGTFADLATVSTVNPDASTHDIFYIVKGLGAVSDKKVIGWFTRDVTAS